MQIEILLWLFQWINEHFQNSISDNFILFCDWVVFHCVCMWWLSGKESTCQCRYMCLIPGSGWSHGEGNGNPRWYFCLGNPRNRRGWWCTVHGVTKELDTIYGLKLSHVVCYDYFFFSVKLFALLGRLTFFVFTNNSFSLLAPSVWSYSYHVTTWGSFFSFIILMILEPLTFSGLD